MNNITNVNNYSSFAVPEPRKRKKPEETSADQPPHASSQKKHEQTPSSAMTADEILKQKYSTNTDELKTITALIYYLILNKKLDAVTNSEDPNNKVDAVTNSVDPIFSKYKDLLSQMKAPAEKDTITFLINRIRDPKYANIVQTCFITISEYPGLNEESINDELEKFSNKTLYPYKSLRDRSAILYSVCSFSNPSRNYISPSVEKVFSRRPLNIHSYFAENRHHDHPSAPKEIYNPDSTFSNEFLNNDLINIDLNTFLVSPPPPPPLEPPVIASFKLEDAPSSHYEQSADYEAGPLEDRKKPVVISPVSNNVSPPLSRMFDIAN